MEKLELEDIIIGCKAGISRYQTALYNMFRPKMTCLIKRYIDCSYIAEEIMNDGFLRIYAKIDLYEYIGSFEGWMRKIMYHSVSDAVKLDSRISSEKKNGWGRRGARVSVADETGLDLLNTKRGVYVTMVDRLGKDELDIMIERLPSSTGKAFKLYINGARHSEIGKELGMAEGTSKWHINEARTRLQKIYKK